MRGMETKESEIISDPRETLGRFFHLFNGMASVDKMVISGWSENYWIGVPNLYSMTSQWVTEK